MFVVTHCRHQWDRQTLGNFCPPKPHWHLQNSYSGKDAFTNQGLQIADLFTQQKATRTNKSATGLKLGMDPWVWGKLKLTSHLTLLSNEAGWTQTLPVALTTRCAVVTFAVEETGVAVGSWWTLLFAPGGIKHKTYCLVFKNYFRCPFLFCCESLFSKVSLYNLCYDINIDFNQKATPFQLFFQKYTFFDRHIFFGTCYLSPLNPGWQVHKPSTWWQVALL